MIILIIILRYCWIPSNDGHNHIAVVMQFVVLYGPMWLCIVYDLVAYGLVWKKQKLMVIFIYLFIYFSVRFFIYQFIHFYLSYFYLS